MRHKILLLLTLVFNTQLIFAQSNSVITVPLGGNAYTASKQENLITKTGIENWTDKNTSFKVYVRFDKVGSLALSLNEVSQVVGENEFGVTINKQTKTINVNEGSSSFKTLEWKITDTGYVAIEIKGLKRTSAQFPNIKSLTLAGSVVNAQTTFVKNNEGNFFYWGRRGPSVHLNYQLPEKVEPEWFYNELTVPVGEDVIGSYFMANGFGQGYFGIQVNSSTERRILFSVWSPFVTDDPKSIPESHQIKMLRKGQGVYTGEFGNEGSGGQSYLKYNWKAGNTYKFLLRGIPTADSTTTYTAYFFAPELDQWQLIASFKRPKTHTYLSRLHSFLENFIPQMGDKERKVLFNNQWICDTKGNWTELNKASFTTDNTGRVNYRKDYAGGTVNGAFYLRNCGFFDDFTVPRTVFTRKSTNQKPHIDLSKLP
jgi:hypothetical protein